MLNLLDHRPLWQNDEASGALLKTVLLKQNKIGLLRKLNIAKTQ